MDLASQEGADAFLTPIETFHFFSTELQKVSRMREKEEDQPSRSETSPALIVGKTRKKKNQNRKNRLKAHEKQDIIRVYTVLGQVADTASRERFAQIPPSEIEAWIDHTIPVLQNRRANANWKASGSLDAHDISMLHATNSFYNHTNAVLVGLRMGFFQALAQLIAALPPTQLPSPSIANVIAVIVCNAHRRLRSPKNSKWDDEAVWKKLQATGILEQFLRCSVCPVPGESVDTARDIYSSYDSLILCPKLLKRSFKEGSPCGDAVRHVVSGSEGYKNPDRKIVEYMATIIKLADVGQSTKEMGVKKKTGMICRFCTKSEYNSTGIHTPMMCCSRCKKVHYCSRTCQLEDWKRHKTECKKLAKEKSCNVSRESVMKIIKEQYVAIMAAFVEATTRTGLKKSDLMLEIDLLPGKDGSTPPALRENPEFKVAPVRGYYKGTRPEEPDWFHKGTTKYAANIHNIVNAIKENAKKMTSDHILVMSRYSSAVSIDRVHMYSEEGAIMCSDSALDAFTCVIQTGDNKPLSLLFPVSFQRLQQQLPLNKINPFFALDLLPNHLDDSEE